MEKISAVVITYNEEHNIEECLKSVQWADEIVVVDSFSTDRTVEIAESLGARVIQNRFEGYPLQKNFSFTQVKYDWIINIDADERVTEELRDELRDLLERGPSHDGYFIYRRNFVFGHEVRYSGWNHDRVLRFIRREKCRYPDRLIHIEIPLENPGVLKGKMLHYTYRTYDDYIEKVRRYIIGAGKDYYNEGRRAKLYNLVFNPAARFLRMYVLQRGFLDGTIGFILASLAAYYVFLKYAELYRLQNEEEKKNIPSQ